VKHDLSRVRSLSHLGRVAPDLAGNHFFGPPRPWQKDWQLFGLVMNFIRLVDVAIGEYESGRRKAEEWWTNTETEGSAYLATSGYFETCLTSMHRAICHLHALKMHRSTPPHFAPALPLTSSVLTKAGDREIELMRHAIQHLEARILGTGQPPIQEGEPFALFLTGHEWQRDGISEKRLDRLTLGGRSIRFLDLTRWLAELHQFARSLAEVW
jgi:hypothetical protein